MLQSFIITLREGVEAALIVGITLAYLTKIGRQELRKTVYAALAAAFLGSIGVAGNPPYSPGTPANCLGATRFVAQGTGGFTYRVYNNPKYGRLQYQLQYSYLTRKAWAGVGGSPVGTNNMVFTGMRYYIP